MLHRLISAKKKKVINVSTKARCRKAFKASVNVKQVESVLIKLQRLSQQIPESFQ